jgi:hypothetical protein
MKSLFTIHAGEFLVGDYIERTFRRTNVWIPTKDTGVALLVSDAKTRQVLSLQVKFSRDFLVTHLHADFQKSLRACGWWSLNRRKIEASSADYWVFVLAGFDNRSRDFVIITPAELLRRLNAIHGHVDRIQSYLWVTKEEKYWETRGLNRPEQVLVAEGRYKDKQRDFSAYLNNWHPIKAPNE